MEFAVREHEDGVPRQFLAGVAVLLRKAVGRITEVHPPVGAEDDIVRAVQATAVETIDDGCHVALTIDPHDAAVAVLAQQNRPVRPRRRAVRPDEARRKRVAVVPAWPEDLGDRPVGRPLMNHIGWDVTEPENAVRPPQRSDLMKPGGSELPSYPPGRRTSVIVPSGDH